MMMQVQGRVYEERLGRGLSGIMVSNTETIVRTDAGGRYTLQVEPQAHRFVFLTVPDGFQLQETFFQSTLDWGDSRRDVDFTLIPAPERAHEHFSLAHMTDTHVVVEENRLTSGEVLTEDVRQLVQEAAPDFLVASGDLTNRGTLQELKSYREAMRTIPTPVFSLFGGHDGNEERRSGEAGTTFTRNYEQILGPTYYSLDWGGRHVVLYPNEEHFFSPEDRQRKECWLWTDLGLQPERKEIIVVVHIPPSTTFFEQLSHYNVTLVLYGHWHSSKVFSYGKITVAATPPLCFGGIDTTPRGYRRVVFRENERQLELRAFRRMGGSLSSEDPPATISLGEESLRLLWKHRLPVGFHRATPLYLGRQIFLSLRDEDSRGRTGISCVETQTGEIRWHTLTNASIKNSVAGVEGRCAAVSITGRVYVLDTASRNILWQADLPGSPDRWVYTSPLIGDKTVYAGAKSGYAAYDLETGDRRWYTPLEHDDTWSCYASPQVAGELLIVLIPRRGLLALNGQEGTVVWERQVAVEYSYPSPVITGEVLVSGGDPAHLAVIRAHSGEVVWHRPVLSSGYVTGLAVHANRIYATTPDGEAQCYDLDSGQRYWRFQTGEDVLDMTPYRRGIRSILAAPVVFRNRAIVCGCDGWLYVLDAASGTCKSRALFGSPITAAPCLMEDGFCVGTYDGWLYRFAE
ncbi:MAG: PQQ-binding-like beta-propeller repeat protein [Candidatus Latescibacteria bacterium]|nr:PQQ-binding-like beta-propeller repeat protein [Candidatus Latescibacterota bacterium]